MTDQFMVRLPDFHECMEIEATSPREAAERAVSLWESTRVEFPSMADGVRAIVFGPVFRRTYTVYAEQVIEYTARPD